jgi:hypothetical protein
VGWYWWRFELSYLSTTAFGARQLRKPQVRSWSEPLLDAFVAGAWFLHWTETTLYWVAKPVVHVERTATARRPHNETGPALESAIENIYFWHGVMVPAFVVVRPDWITIQHIDTETNAEVRRVMIERYGIERYIRDAGATIVHSDLDQYGRTRRLLRRELANDEPVVMVEVTNATVEPDGSFRKYMMRVDPKAFDGRAGRECHAAIASTWRKKGDHAQLFFKRPEDYEPTVET